MNPGNQEKEGEKIKLDTTNSFVHYCSKEFIALKLTKLIVFYIWAQFLQCMGDKNESGHSKIGNVINKKQVTVRTLSALLDMLVGCHLIRVFVTRKLF